jgi:hypothetical protein
VVESREVREWQFFFLLLELRDGGLSLLELGLSLTESIGKCVIGLFGSESSLFPEFSTAGEVSTADLSGLEFGFAFRRFGFPSVSTGNKFGNENPGWATESENRGRLLAIHATNS